MKIDCKPRRCDGRKQANPYWGGHAWKRSLPFNVNPRGVLIHRVRTGVSFFNRGKRTHDAVTYWCGNQACGEGVSLTDSPPSDRLLCVHCERLAVEAGEPTAEELAGRHVCTGVMKAFRLCCRNDQN